MQITTIDAGNLLEFQQFLRNGKKRLIRARPYKNENGADRYEVMYI